MTAIGLLDAMAHPALFGPWFAAPSWDAWRAVLKGALALPMSNAERAVFRVLAEREPPTSPVRELWIIVGRRAGKDSVASLIAAHTAACRDYSAYLRPGERALIQCLAVDRDQAKIVLNYTRAYFDRIPTLHALKGRETATGLELSNGTEIAIATNDFRAVRGRATPLVIMDELAFWRDETTASPDTEVYRAVMPSLATIPGSLIIGLSSPYSRRGVLYDRYKRHFGQDGDVLVIKAPSIALNPTLDQAMIDRAIEEDPEGGAAEWLAEFRRDIAAFVSREAVEACVVVGRYELPSSAAPTWCAFLDAAGGSGSDSMTLAIASSGDDGRAILGCIREVRPPFSPDAVCRDFAETLRAHAIERVVGDAYAGDWPAERLQQYGISYERSELPKGAIYRESLPLLNAGALELLDHPRFIGQLCSLERRTARGGRDSIDHPPGGHDDICNAALGALLIAHGGLARRPQMVFGAIPNGANLNLRRHGPSPAQF